ncbi:hypothetical protein [Pedobacter helvus]|uniref:Uncharacterized protein n=1 Tax=Pedobacter helvus TaxID=2563444 RepID=A0ABW9JHK9_9SPHI|nr:hypothetical protein [Pedobacter ureilyticus]
MKNLSLLFTGLILLLSACKKSTIDPQKTDELQDRNGAVQEVFGGQLFNDAANFIPSFDGNYALIRTNSENKQFQYTKDAGATWQELKSVKEVFAVNDKGFYVYDPQTGARQFSKLGAADAGFSYNITGGEFILGKDDYIYDFNPFINTNKVTLINTLNGQTTVVNNQADTLGKYCGQDQNGGIAFINHKGLSIHQPRSNEWVFHPFNIVRLYFTSNNVSQPSKFHFNGYNQLVIADQIGYHVYQIGQKNALRTFNWPNPYTQNYENPKKIEINQNGDVFATILRYGGKPVMFKITDGNMAAYPRSTYTVCKGAYTYEMHPLTAKKISAAKTENINGLLKEARDFKNAYITATKVYAIYPIEPAYSYYNGEASPGADTVLCYDRNTNTNKFLSVSGHFNFVYQDGNKAFVSGNNVLMYTANHGDTWEKIVSPITNNLVEVKKIGNTYYGMCKTVDTYTSTYGTSYSNSFKMLSSIDLKTWTLLPNAAYDSKAGSGPSTFTKDGFLSYISSTTGGLIFKNYSTDFGKTWQSTSDPVIVFSAELNDGKLVNFNHNGGSQLYYDVYERNGITGELKARITYNAPTGRSFTTSTPRTPVVGENGSFYFFNSDKIYQLN